MGSDKTSSTPSDGISCPQGVRPLHGRTSGPKRRSRQWNAEEDEILRQAVQQFKGKSWKKIAECFKDRTDVQCLHRWQKVLDPELVKGSWSKEEDEILIELVNTYGAKKWSTVAQHLAGRIGKQCRERWHNHLNPAINKEAWTQDEELALIRAHQIYGNKWAELSKILPGRTDNAIKNHWNSSVKKKLDSYLASGLLAQFPSLPNINPQSQSIPSSSMKLLHSREDESVHQDRIVKDEVSECSQGSSLLCCSHSTSDLGNTCVHIRDYDGMSEQSLNKKNASSSAAPCSKNYIPAFQEVSCSEPEVPTELADSRFLEHNYSHDLGNYIGKDWEFNRDDIPNISLELIQETSGLFMHYLNGNENLDMVPFPLQTVTGSRTTPNSGNVVEGSYRQNEMFSCVDGCRVVHPAEGISQCSPHETGVNGNGEPEDSLMYQPSKYPILETRDIAPHNCNASSLHDIEASCHQAVSVHSQFSSEDRSLVFGIGSNQLYISTPQNPVQKLFTSGYDGVIYPSESAAPADNGTDYSVLTDRLDHTNNSCRLVSVNDLGSPTSNAVQKGLLNENAFILKEQKDGGALCYEPPRFPSLDVPFLSCGLIQSGLDTQQDYSPLGIRQLMMTSANCLTPLRLWDSPSKDYSPDAILKSAAKTLTWTPILKKRHRHLVTPLSEKRCEKRQEKDFNKELFSNMTAEFSRLHDMFDESANGKDSTEDKENEHPSSEDGRKEMGDGVTGLSCCGNSKRQLDGGGAQYCKEPHSKSAGANDGMGNVKQHPEVLVELRSNDLFFPTDRFLVKCDRATSLSNKALGNQYARRLEAASNQVTVSSSFETSCSSVGCSPDIHGKHRSSFVVATSIQSATSTAMENKAENSENGFRAETASIFGETPFKRSIESPSAWKSPWFMNSFLPSPRCDAELAFEDIALFMSPDDRSYDAIGLMKQLSEQTADSIADAHQILGNETPETPPLRTISKKQKADEYCSPLASNAVSERRTLDFSECDVTPAKGKGTTKFDSGNSFSSPSSYMLKCCCR